MLPGQWFPTGGPGGKNAPMPSHRSSLTLSTILLITAFLAMAGCSSSTEKSEVAATPAVVQPLELLRVEVLQTVPHDPAAFTQGLLIEDGSLFESTGRNGSSTLRQVDLATGEVQRSVPVDDALFAEGLALVGDRLIQLTWQAGRALVYDANTFDLVDEFSYDTEGWGLCDLGDELAMSDGTSTLTFRSPDTFAALRTVTVRRAGTLVADINELECVDGAIWANVWKTDTILRIDPTTGAVTGVVDAAGLLTPEQAASADVLNGIAYDDADDTFWITGKWWPSLFQVRFQPISDE